jgi:hypothetical protein
MKDIWSQYFTRHADTVDEIKGKVNGVTQAFDEWKMFVMNPQSINEARIHSLDVKWDDIENQVNVNFNLIYDIVKKLLFSLQQQVLTVNNSMTLEPMLDDGRSALTRHVDNLRPDTGKSYRTNYFRNKC